MTGVAAGILARLVKRAVARNRARVAAELAARFPALDVKESDEGVVIAGRGLARRLLHDVTLRSIGSLFR